MRAMQSTGTEVYCYIAMIPLFRAESKVVCAIEKELRIARQLGAKLLMIVPGARRKSSRPDAGREKKS